MSNTKAMKRIILTAFIATLVACYHKGPKVIVNKSYKDYWGDPMQNGLCRYWYDDDSWHASVEFTDSIGKYDIGDTIIARAK